jgi:phosphoribosylglycinamide formyltransferase-1
MTNEQRAEALIQKYRFDFASISRDEIRELIELEIEDFQEGSSEYIRLLCGYLYCVGDITDVPLLERAKYGINMDVGCMVDWEWVESLKNGGVETEFVNSRENIIQNFIAYYQDFEADDEW